MTAEAVAAYSRMGLDDYHVLELIGEGSFGKVTRACQMHQLVWKDDCIGSSIMLADVGEPAVGCASSCQLQFASLIASGVILCSG